MFCCWVPCFLVRGTQRRFPPKRGGEQNREEGEMALKSREEEEIENVGRREKMKCWE